ncbi:MAG: glycerate dehydrogenase [Chloroflexi bacterium]|nr:glycerate dehydrogenase [Chloroflexota bacterium]
MLSIVVPDDAPPAVAGSPVEARLRELGQLRIYPSLSATEEVTAERIRDAQVVINVRATTPLTAKVLRQCPHLKHIAVFGIGVDNIDLAACQELGITVTNTPGYSAAAVAEAAIALALAVVRRIPQNDRLIRQDGWAREPVGQLHGKTLGVIGVGAIGQRTARLGAALGMRVIAWTFHPSPERAQEYGVEFLSLGELLRAADVVSLHLPLTEASRGLLGRRELGLMKPTAVLVNTARGAIVDEEALAEALRERRIGGAGLDVFAVEPLPPGHPLKALDSVVLSPHNAAMTPETALAGLQMVAENIAAWLEGNPSRVVA